MTRARPLPWVIAAVLGLLLGVVCGAWLSSGLDLVPWAIGALALGAASRDRTVALGSAALFGFVVSVSFLVAGYDGSSSFVARTAFFLVLGLFGALCGLALGALGRLLGRLLAR